MVSDAPRSARATKEVRGRVSPHNLYSLALASGARLGPYEIISPLGAGGMGEVYRARDSRHDRVVALKVLPDGIAASPQNV